MPAFTLVARNLHKAYVLHKQKLPILCGAEMTVSAGETLAIVGRSGAGKSTLMHILGGLDRPDAGEVFLGETALYALGARKRAKVRAARIGFVFQAYHLLPEMDITENVMLPAMALGKASKATIRKRAEELLERVGLSERRRHMPAELSGGEQQRAAIARALMNEPPLILADEPTGNLDATTGDCALHLLFDLVREQETILVMVTHNPETAARCHRTLRLENGLLV